MFAEIAMNSAAFRQIQNDNFLVNFLFFFWIIQKYLSFMAQISEFQFRLQKVNRGSLIVQSYHAP